MRELTLRDSGELTYGEAIVQRDGWGQWRAWIPDEPHSKTGVVLSPRASLEDLLDRLDELAGPG